MHSQIGHDGHPRNGSTSVELGVAEESGSSVVEDVEELEFLLLDDQEDGVR